MIGATTHFLYFLSHILAQQCFEMYVNGAPELGETLFMEKIWKSTVIEMKHIAVLTIITLMVHKNILLSLCWLLVTAGTLCHLCSVIALLADFNIFMSYCTYSL